MAGLHTFNTGMSLWVPEDQPTEEILNGLTAGFTFAQDNANGFPSYDSVEADKIYRDTYPQQIQVTESVQAGDLLNIYFDVTPKVRLATARDKNKFANSLALSSGTANSLVWCAVKTAVIPFNLSGDLWLSDVPGKITQTPAMSMEIIQHVGIGKAGIFQFYFHTPALTKPFSYPYLQRSV